MPRTVKQVLAEQRKQAERGLAQKQAQPVAVVKPAALPAVPDHRTARERYLDDVAPSGVVGRLIKFSKEGKFAFHDDGEAIPESEDFVVLADQTLVSWVKFNGEGEPPTRRGGLLYQGFVLPPRDELGDPEPIDWPIGLSGRAEDPWKHEQMIVLRQPKTLELFTFCTASKTGRRAVGTLLKHHDRVQRTNPGAFPVVRLKASGYQDSRYGWVHTPLFVVVGMTSGPSDPSGPADSSGQPGRSGYSAALPDTSLKGQLNDEIGF